MTAVTKSAAKTNAAKAKPAKAPAKKAAPKKTPAKAAQVEALVVRAAQTTPAPSAIASQVAQTPAAAPATPKTVRKASGESKPKKAKSTAAVVAFVARRMTAGQMLHVLDEPSRPTSGVRLFAHTHAALHVLGLFDAARPALPKKAVLTVMGQTAVSYHLRQRNFEAAPDGGLRLSVIGYNKFKDRAVDGALANGFTEMLLTGKIDAALGVRAQNVYAAATGA